MTNTAIIGDIDIAYSSSSSAIEQRIVIHIGHQFSHYECGITPTGLKALRKIRSKTAPGPSTCQTL